MIIVTYEKDHPSIDEMFRLRARILHDRWQWNVTLIGGFEMDELDHNAHPLYLLYTEDLQSLRGCCRLLPTTGQTMLSTFFGDVFKEQLAAPTIWECSKFCLAEDILDNGFFAIGHAAAVLLTGMARVCWRHEIEAIIGVVDEKAMKLYSQLGIDIEVLEEAQIDGKRTFSTIHHLEPRRLRKIAEFFGEDILEKATLQWELPAPERAA
jgi:N-acyl-L-homoserine lactone synthetase